MRKLITRMMTGALVLLLSSGASAGTLYRWTTADGVVSYSDELKRIPEALRASAVRIQTASLASYEHYTPSRAANAAGYAERLDARVERLRALNATADAELTASAAPSPAGFPPAAIRVNRNLSIGIPSQQLAGDAPIVVEEQRVRTGDSTTHIYVVRQGERILSIVRPHTNHSSAGWPTEQELLGED